MCQQLFAVLLIAILKSKTEKKSITLNKTLCCVIFLKYIHKKKV